MTNAYVPGSASEELIRLLETSANVQIAGTASRARVLLNEGAQVDDRMREAVQRIGERFEFYRDSFAPRLLDEADAGLTLLYELFTVSPVPRRTIDTQDLIDLPSGNWKAQHDGLWDALVPSSGAATTVQGELIRVTGRIRTELHDNGGANWDADYALMAASIPAMLRQGTPIDAELTEEASSLAGSLLTTDTADRLAELAVCWVAANREPLPLAQPAYRR